MRSPRAARVSALGELLVRPRPSRRGATRVAKASRRRIVCSAEREEGKAGTLKTVLAQGAPIVLTAGLVDAAYSGDWSRIGVLSPETEDTLKLVLVPVLVERLILFWFILSRINAQGRDDVDVNPWLVARALLGGSLSVLNTLRK